jgi:serine/threonine protein kinase
MQVMQALLVVASKLVMMHAGGWVHFDLKSSNILRMPAMHSWTLIDFGCSARAGEPAAHAMQGQTCVTPMEMLLLPMQFLAP